MIIKAYPPSQPHPGILDTRGRYTGGEKVLNCKLTILCCHGKKKRFLQMCVHATLSTANYPHTV